VNVFIENYRHGFQLNFQMLKLVFLVDRGDWPHCLVTNLYYRREVDGLLAYQTSLRSLQVAKMLTSKIVNRTQELARSGEIRTIMECVKYDRFQ
jgi:hypothetical protein